MPHGMSHFRNLTISLHESYYSVYIIHQIVFVCIADQASTLRSTNVNSLCLPEHKHTSPSSPGVPSDPAPHEHPPAPISNQLSGLTYHNTCPLKITKTSNEKRGSRERKQLAACESVGAARGPTTTRTGAIWWLLSGSSSA